MTVRKQMDWLFSTAQGREILGRLYEAYKVGYSQSRRGQECQSGNLEVIFRLALEAGYEAAERESKSVAGTPVTVAPQTPGRAHGEERR